MFLETQLEQQLDNRLQMRPATMADLQQVVALINACGMAQMGAPQADEADVRVDWELPHFDTATSTRVVETDTGEIIGYIEVWDTDSLPVSNWVWGRVHPDYEGQGIGTALMEWAEARLQTTLARVPADLEVSYKSSTLNTYAPARHLFESMGMELVRRFYRMVIELEGEPPEAVWPEGMRLTTFAEHGNLEAVIGAFDEAFKDHWGHVDQPLDEQVEKWRHWLEGSEDFDPTLWFVALDGEEIAGVSLCWPKMPEDEEMGWVNILGVRRPWRKQGLGLALLHHTFGEFYRRSKARVGLGVDAGSLTGATRLYEKAGMHVAREFVSFEKVVRPGRKIAKEELDD